MSYKRGKHIQALGHKPRIVREQHILVIKTVAAELRAEQSQSSIEQEEKVHCLDQSQDSQSYVTGLELKPFC